MLPVLAGCSSGAKSAKTLPRFTSIPASGSRTTTTAKNSTTTPTTAKKSTTAPTTGKTAVPVGYCITSTWPSFIQGRPTELSAKSPSRTDQMFIWHDATGFHLRRRVASASVATSGTVTVLVTSSAKMGKPSAIVPKGFSPSVNTTGNTMSVGFPPTAGVTGIDVNGCVAHQLSFGFSVGTLPLPTAAIFVGATGTATDSTVKVQR